jgi:ADP-ribosyl-[dinitrogen reductase] hydrolase
VDVGERIRAAIVAFCAGDAVGAPWEGLPPGEVDPDRVDDMPPRREWGSGVTTDDTAQLLIVAEVLVEGGDEVDFLTRLVARFPGIRGSGPTTTAAVERFRATGATVATTGATNGAVMRALPVGWACAPHHADRRRDLVTRLTRTTHGSPRAVLAAAVVAAAGAASLTPGAGVPAVVEAAAAEAAVMAERLSLPPAAWQELRDVRRRTASPARVSLDAVETATAALAVVAAGGDLRDVLHRAVRLGGDTDTVAAIAGGIAGALAPEQVRRLPFLPAVVLPDPAEVDRLAAGLAARRDVT